MKKIIIPKSLEEYKIFIKKEIVVNEEFYGNDFYSGLIDFIIDNRTPIFFYASKDYEYAHFTQYFKWVLIRESYHNTYMKDLYFIHDFIHMLFYYPPSPRQFSLNDFREIIVTNERIAANDTEIYTYYRLPEIRKYTFNDKILYDFISLIHKNNADVYEMYNLRNQLIESKQIPEFLNNPDGKAIMGFLKRFRDNNKLWINLWWKNFPKNGYKYIDHQMNLPVIGYEKFLSTYKSIINQEGYEKNILKNVILGLQLLGEKEFPKNFNEIDKYIKIFENKIFMESVAKKYHKAYIKAKYG